MSSFQSKYKVLEKIGEGSFSEVLKCEHKPSHTCYAAKRLKKVYKTEASIMSCAEIIAAQKVPFHQNILNMLEFHYDSFSGKVIFIFELMDMSMHDYLKTKRRGLSEHRVRNYLYQMLKGLEHLHKYGLFHRDVKPENILIKFPSILYGPLSQTSQSEIIKLADLGSVRGIFSAPPYTEYISTRWYRSPECLLTAGNYGPKMDVWATGCVFYEMLTLKPLFPGSNEIDQLCKIHQIMGSPSIQYLSRLKSKSRNCIFFPKIKGTGIDIMLPYITKNGRNILRLMIEYDSEKRINIKRLLRNCYFDDIKQPDGDITEKPLAPLKSPIAQKPTESVKRSMGDDGTFTNSTNVVKKKIPKREHYPDELRKSSKGSSKSVHSKHSDSGTKCITMPTIEIPYYSPRKPTRINKANANNFKVTSLPLVDYKVLSMGQQAAVENYDNKVKVLRSRTLKKDANGKFLKTTSNLESVKCKMNIRNTTRTQLQSKSFVLPRRMGQHKIETLSDTKESVQPTCPKIRIYREVRHT